MDFEEFGFDGGRSVTILRMGDSMKGKELVIPDSWSLAHLLTQAAQKLSMDHATKVFNKDGTEVTDVDLIGQNDVLYFSNDSSKHGANGGARGGGKGGQMELIGNYYMGRFLGKGAFGEVRIAHHRISGEEYAVKFIKKEGIKDFQNAERMSAEIMALTVLRHPNVLHMYEVFDTADSTCYVMEYVPGGDLLNYIVQNGSLDEYTMFKYFQQIISAVEYCHGQNIIHRDLKLENILLDKEQKNIKIADFGLCGVVLPDPTDDQGGTRAYSAPELFKGKTGITSALDIWSIGVIVFALLYGKLPFNSDNGPVLVDNILVGKYHIPPGSISPQLQDLISRMLTVNIKKRATIVDIHCHTWVQQMRRRVLMEKAESKHATDYDDFAMDTIHHDRNDAEIPPASIESSPVAINPSSGPRRPSVSSTTRTLTKIDTRGTLPEIGSKAGKRLSKPGTATSTVSPRPPTMGTSSPGSSSFRKKPDFASSEFSIKPRMSSDTIGPPQTAEKFPNSSRKKGPEVPPLALPHSPNPNSSSMLPEINSTPGPMTPSTPGAANTPSSVRHNRILGDPIDSGRRKTPTDWKTGYKGYVQGYRRANNTAAS